MATPCSRHFGEARELQHLGVFGCGSEFKSFAQVLVFGSVYQGAILVHDFEPQPFRVICRIICLPPTPWEECGRRGGGAARRLLRQLGRQPRPGGSGPAQLRELRCQLPEVLKGAGEGAAAMFEFAVGCGL